jgi:hypothetical protein
MDPITAAIVAALPALAADLAKSSVKDAYAALKALIRRKWGNTSGVAKAVDDLETDPGSAHRAAVLSDQLASTRAVEDPDIMKALAALRAELKEARGSSPGASHVTISGGTFQGVVGAQTVTVDTMNFAAPPKSTRN